MTDIHNIDGFEYKIGVHGKVFVNTSDGWKRSSMTVNEFNSHNKSKEKSVNKGLWTTLEIKFIKDNFDSMSDEELAESLNRPLKGLMGKRQQLGLLRKQRTNPTHVNTQVIKKLVNQGYSINLMTKELNVSRYRIIKLLEKLPRSVHDDAITNGKQNINAKSSKMTKQKMKRILEK